MGFTFDYFVGHLKCDVCGKVSAADDTTNIQTKLAVNRAMAPYGVGDFIEIVDNIEDNGYVCIRKPVTPKTFSTVESWECPSCDNPYNWVKIEIFNGTIRSMQSTKLDSELGGKANYISEECKYLGWDVKNGELINIRKA